MDRLGLIGVNWRHSDPRILEQLTLSADERDERLPEILDATGVTEMVYLATCNRVEILFADHGDKPLAEYRPLFFEALMGRPAKAGEAERTLRAWGGEGAVEHLLLVAAGLDSAQIGEHEIRGQLRSAHDEARRLGLSGSRLDFVIRRAIGVAREVQQRTGLMDGRISIAEVGLDGVRRHLKTRPKGAPETVALVGVSPMTERCAEELHREGIPLIFVNRTEATARRAAEALGCDARSLESFRLAPPPLAAVIAATGADRPVIDGPCLQRLARHGGDPFLVDFGMPSDIDGEAAEELGFSYWSMAEISRQAERNQDRRKREASHARELVDEALIQLRRQMAERSMAPVLSEIGRRYRETADAGVERLFRKELRHLSGDERDAVSRFAHNLAKRLAHLPSVGLRSLAAEFGVDAVDSFLTAADEVLAQELKNAVRRDDLFAVSAPQEDSE